MDTKLTQSKINLLRAQLNQLTDCGLFNEAEIEKLSIPKKKELDELEGKLKEELEKTPPEDFEVNEPQIIR